MNTILKILATILLSLYLIPVKAQTSTDKIIVVQNTYTYDYINEKIYNSKKIKIKNKDKIVRLTSMLEEYEKTDDLLAIFEVDKNYIENNIESLLKFHSGFYKDKIVWNKKQKEYIYTKLRNFDIYEDAIKSYLSNGCCYTMNHWFRYEYVIKIYRKGQIINTFTSQKSIWGYHFPYKDASNKSIYNYQIDNLLSEFFNQKEEVEKPLKGEEMLAYLVNKIIEDNIKELYELSGYSYEKEISELMTDFTLISHEEVYARGRYIYDEPKVIKITLKNDLMLPNVNLQFLASVVDNKLYSRDSLKAEYENIVNRIQSIDLIRNYLENDSSAILDIYYFNNKGINEYNIDGVNKNPEEWKKFDNGYSSPKFQHLYCGCNYRFERDFIEKAIFFEITSEVNSSSLWFLLPDERILLHHVQSYNLEYAKVLGKKLNQFGNDIDLPFACLRFDKKGNLIKK